MESLYRKYRPLTFDSVVGQQHIVSTLEHAITEGRLSHAYLFCGPRGTGKTTMARILAKALLCRNAEAARAEGASGCMPDGTCEECELIAEGNHPDVYELDAASRTGVDNVREEIINSVNFAPVRGKYKIYIIDEVHMLTTAAFNALLKTLEEPPAHVIFVLCTTDPQKILETILSRCQRFDFHRISNEDIEHRLSYVCEQEGFDYDDEALTIVARHAKGGMRDALSTLEQLSVFGNGAVHADDARSLLGEVSDQILGEFARAIAERDIAELYGLIRAQVEEGNDLLELTRDLVAHARDVYVACVAGARAELFEGGAEQAEALAAEAAAFGEHPADRLARVLTVLDDAALEMRGASDVRLVLEIACTRLARPEADLTIEALAERVARLEAMVANAAVPASVAAAQASAPAAVAAAPATTQQPTLISGARAATPAATAAPAATPAHQGGMPWDRGAAVPAAQPAPKSAAPAPAPKPVTPAPQPVAAPAPAPAASTVPVSKSNNAAQVAAAGAAETPAVEDAGELQRKWGEVVERVKAQQPSYAALLLNARATADDGSKLTVSFPTAFAIKMLGRADTQAVFLPTVSAVFGHRTVDYVLDGGGTPAPQHEEHSPSARAAASADPQPVSSVPPASSSASATQPKAAPVAAPTPSAPEPAAPKPAAPIPAPKSAAAPAPKSSDLAKAPWLRSDNPAGAPATGKLPTEPAPRAPERASAPMAQPPAQAAPWESEQVPYDDAMVGGFAADAGGDDLPPFDVPGAASAPKAAAVAPAASANDDVPAAPWESNPGAGSPFGHQGAAPSIPQTEDEAKALIRSVFGQATIFKPVE
ncbi:DNA polymerase III subunit gamma/tau [Collinsella sp. CLA-AA-H167]|uniref:DNA polymerase III subunit gamma/tau n=1 Tax=Collinsella sp. CLA-AA-H167 TaxID=3136223 RepID=UPI0032C00339